MFASAGLFARVYLAQWGVAKVLLAVLQAALLASGWRYDGPVLAGLAIGGFVVPLRQVMAVAPPLPARRRDRAAAAALLVAPLLGFAGVLGALQLDFISLLASSLAGTFEAPPMRVGAALPSLVQLVFFLAIPARSKAVELWMVPAVIFLPPPVSLLVGAWLWLADPRPAAPTGIAVEAGPARSPRVAVRRALEGVPVPNGAFLVAAVASVAVGWRAATGVDPVRSLGELVDSLRLGALYLPHVLPVAAGVVALAATASGRETPGPWLLLPARGRDMLGGEADFGVRRGVMWGGTVAVAGAVVAAWAGAPAKEALVGLGAAIGIATAFGATIRVAPHLQRGLSMAAVSLGLLATLTAALVPIVMQTAPPSPWAPATQGPMVVAASGVLLALVYAAAWVGEPRRV